MPDPRGDDPLSELFGDFPERLRGDHWQPSIDVFETEKAIVVRAEVAGLRGEDIHVNVHGDLLRIRGVRRVPEGEQVQRLHQMEIAFGPFERTVRIGVPYERDQVRARIDEGFLEVTLPKRAPGRRRIEVDVE